MYGGIKTGQVNVDNTVGGVQIVAARPGRGSVTITNTGTTIVYLGLTGLTTSTGDYLAGVAGASKTYSTQEAIYGITGGSAQTVTYAEAF